MLLSVSLTNALSELLKQNKTKKKTITEQNRKLSIKNGCYLKCGLELRIGNYVFDLIRVATMVTQKIWSNETNGLKIRGKIDKIYLLQYNKADASSFTSSVINTTQMVL